MNTKVIAAEIKAIVNRYDVELKISASCPCVDDASCEVCRSDSNFNKLRSDILGYVEKISNYEAGKHYNP